MTENNTLIFNIEKDRFSCILVDTKTVKWNSEQDFNEKLKSSLDVWKKSGIRGVWVKVDIQHSSLIPFVIQNKFVYHHAKSDYVMCKQWLSENEVECLPGYATQYLGCAGFVLNESGQLLVIQERYHEKKRWKLPGGLAEPGEDIAQAAKREVMEETGIDAEFQYVLCFRHQHHFHFDQSDFYFICVMKASNTEIKMCQSEISDARWMEIDEYINNKNVTLLNRFIAEHYMKNKDKPHLGCTAMTSYNGKHVTQVYSVQ